MTNTTPSKSEQARAILGGPEAMSKFIHRHFGGDKAAAKSSWTVTRDEVVREAKLNGIPGSWFRTTAAPHDGLYLLQEGRSWVIKLQERGVEYGRESFPDRDSALEEVVDAYYLPDLLKKGASSRGNQPWATKPRTLGRKE